MKESFEYESKLVQRLQDVFSHIGGSLLKLSTLDDLEIVIPLKGEEVTVTYSDVFKDQDSSGDKDQNLEDILVYHLQDRETNPSFFSRLMELGKEGEDAFDLEEHASIDLNEE